MRASTHPLLVKTVFKDIPATYEFAAEVVAMNLFLRCHDTGDGLGTCVHNEDNEWLTICDMLRRLGMMAPGKDHMKHEYFLDDWVPGKPATIIRHIIEPPFETLVSALGYFADWKRLKLFEGPMIVSTRADLPPPIVRLPIGDFSWDSEFVDVGDQNRMDHLIDYTSGMLASLLIELGRAEWDGNGNLNLISYDSAWYDAYWHERFDLERKHSGLGKTYPRESD